MEGRHVRVDALPRLLLSQSPACHWAVDWNFELLQVYGDCLPLFRATVEHLVGRNILDLIPPDWRDRWAERISAALHGETSCFACSVGVVGGEVAHPYQVALFPVRIRRGDSDLALAGGMGLRMVDPENPRAESLRLLHFLHDDVGQDLSVAGLKLELLRMDTEPTQPVISHRASEAQQILERVLGRVRQFSEEVRRRIS